MCGHINEPIIRKASWNDCDDSSKEARMNSDISPLWLRAGMMLSHYSCASDDRKQYPEASKYPMDLIFTIWNNSFI